MPAMGADAWSEWAGRAPQAPPGMPSVPAGPPELDDLHELIVTWAARLIGTRDVLLWLVEEDGQRLVVRYGTGRFSASVGRSLHKGSSWATTWARLGWVGGVPVLHHHPRVGPGQRLRPAGRPIGGRCDPKEGPGAAHRGPPHAVMASHVQ